MTTDASHETATRPLPLGVNVAGYFGATVGLGEAGRQVADALERAGVAVRRVEIVHGSAPRQASDGAAPRNDDALHPVTIVCVSPEGMAAARDQLPDVFAATRVVGLWWWEVPAFPPRFMRAFDDVDEVWVGSRFVADVLAAVAPVPVVRMALPVAAPRPAEADRAALGLPDAFTFGFVFDYASVVERKNPGGLIDAFRRAFPAGDDGAALVLKTIGADRHADAHAAVLAEAAGHPGIHVIDRHLPAAAKDALIAHLDCYVSLHRSEGFGLTLAEAALLGVPVVATDYGGTRDFLTPFNAFLVDYRVSAIGPGHDPYPADGEWAEPDVDHAAALLREVRERPAQARARAERARADVIRGHAPATAGAAMAERVGRLLHVAGAGGGGAIEEIELGDLRARLRAGPPAGGGVRAGARRALLRALRPYSVHQRLLDEEIVRAVRTLDERVRGIAAAQRALAAEVRELRRVEDGDGVPPSPGP
jgi:hypothetical protein